MHKRYILIGAKLLFALLALSAIVTEIATITERGTFAPANFFSYFTIESNLFAAVILGLSSLALVPAKRKDHPKLAWLRGAATTYMTTTGIVFAVLLAGLDVELTAVPWDNIVLHYIMPIAVLADWLIDPPRRRVPLRQAFGWLVYPLVYVAYNLVRGAFVHWYPYPFLDPNQGGYGAVAITSLAIAAFVIILTWLLTRVSAQLPRHRGGAHR